MSRRYLLLLISVITLFLGISCVTGPFSAGSELYYSPYITFPQENTTVVAVNWITPRDEVGEISWGVSPSRMTVTQSTPEGSYHQAILKALKSNTLYYYTVDGGERIHRFNTPKVEEESLSLAIVGGGSGVVAGSVEASFISRSIKFSHPDVVVQLNSFTEFALFPRPRESTFATIAPYSMEIPFFPVPSVYDYGNKDFAEKNLEFLATLFPGSYSPFGDMVRVYGELVRLVFINPDDYQDDHVRWIRSTLQKPFQGSTLVFFNKNPFQESSPSGSSEEEEFSDFWSQFMGVLYDVDLSYLFWGETLGFRYYSFPLAGREVHFFGTGGNGEVVDRYQALPEETVGLNYAMDSSHYLMAYITKESLTLEVLQVNGEPFLEKGEPLQWVFPIDNP